MRLCQQNKAKFDYLLKKILDWSIYNKHLTFDYCLYLMNDTGNTLYGKNLN